MTILEQHKWEADFLWEKIGNWELERIIPRGDPQGEPFYLEYRAYLSGLGHPRWGSTNYSAYLHILKTWAWNIMRMIDGCRVNETPSAQVDVQHFYEAAARFADWSLLVRREGEVGPLWDIRAAFVRCKNLLPTKPL